MCGIAGFIGKSKNLNLSFRLISALLEECESRGADAAGFWGCEAGDNSIAYHKEPIKATDLIAKNVWRDISKLDLDLMLVHARGASAGVGSPAENKNNHPFTSSCKSIGLVHNGRIPDSEYDLLTKRYEVFSKCDSEILLRIFEGSYIYSVEEQSAVVEGETVDAVTAKRLMGLRDIWSFIDRGHMAVAIGERGSAGERRLFLFRNKHRSLRLADVRQELGQVFFCSTPEIWNNAFRSSGANKIVKGRVKLAELPTEELWILQTDETIPVPTHVKKYDICSAGSSLWKHEGDIVKIPLNEPVATVIGKLDDNEEVIQPKTGKKALHYLPAPCKSVCDSYDDDVVHEDLDSEGWAIDYSTPGMEEVSAACENMRTLVTDFEETTRRMLMVAQLSQEEVTDLLQSIEQISLDLEGTIKMMGK